jgi:hydrogenase maturation protein HypF
VTNARALNGVAIGDARIDSVPTLSHVVPEIARTLRRGSIVALRTGGGFRLLCDARNPHAVQQLRERKGREATPFAVLMPSLADAQARCHVDWQQEAVLRSINAPIVLVRPRPGSDLAPNVTGTSPYVGVRLPDEPLLRLLAHELPSPLVITSGNRAGDPVVDDCGEARAWLASIADLMVTDDRPAGRGRDDSVARVGMSGTSLLRRAHGFGPLRLEANLDIPATLAVGGHAGNTVAIAAGHDVIVSEHIGDLDTAHTRRRFVRTIEQLCQDFAFEPSLVVADRHPDYASRQWADSCGLPVLSVQHHHAHIASCAAEHGVAPPYLGIAWDDGGLGEEGEIWGGDGFVVSESGFERVAHLRPFRLIGGDASTREGWRVAVAMDWAMRGQPALDARADGAVLDVMLRHGTNAPAATSVGRLFDAVATITGLRPRSRFEGDTVLALEAAIAPYERGSYPFGDGLIGDWAPLLAAIRRDLDRRTSIGVISARFHWTLVEWICRIADRLPMERVVLSGSVFHNTFLLDHMVRALTACGHTALTHRHLPANDAALSLGQLALAGNLGMV